MWIRESGRAVRCFCLCVGVLVFGMNPAMSVELIATGVIPAPSTCPRPVQPSHSLYVEESGIVRVGVLIEHDGSVSKAKIAISSTFKALDQAALESARRCRFARPVDETGKSVLQASYLDFKFHHERDLVQSKNDDIAFSAKSNSFWTAGGNEKFMEAFTADSYRGRMPISEGENTRGAVASQRGGNGSQVDYSSGSVRVSEVSDTRRKLHDPLAVANHCIELDPNNKLYGGFVNKCGKKISYGYCAFHPKKDTWLDSAFFDCERNMARMPPQPGGLTIAPGGRDTEHTNGAEQIHWFACTNGAEATDLHWNGSAIEGKCIRQ